MKSNIFALTLPKWNTLKAPSNVKNTSYKHLFNLTICTARLRIPNLQEYNKFCIKPVYSSWDKHTNLDEQTH